MMNSFTFTDFRGNVDDVFYNNFDITWMKAESNIRNGSPRTFTRLPIENAQDDGSVLYEYNEDYFRCDNFKNAHQNTPHILFAGCSQTEGVGAPLETVWSKLVLNSISPQSGFYSIAKSGYGWQKIITNFMIYVDRFGAPDYLFALLPNVGRFFEWDKISNSYIYVQRYPNGHVEQDAPHSYKKDEHGNFTSILEERRLEEEEHKKFFIDFVIGWKTFERYCDAIGTKVIWSSWDYQENRNYKKAGVFSGYVDLTVEGFSDFIKEKRPDGKLEKFDLSRRDGHSGILENEYWQSVFVDAIRKREWL